MSQDVLARAIGLSRASIANIETGRQKVLLHHVYLLASALGCRSITELISEEVRRDGIMPKVEGNAGFTDKQIAQAQNLFLQAALPNKGR